MREDKKESTHSTVPQSMEFLLCQGLNLELHTCEVGALPLSCLFEPVLNQLKRLFGGVMVEDGAGQGVNIIVMQRLSDLKL